MRMLVHSVSCQMKSTKSAMPFVEERTTWVWAAAFCRWHWKSGRQAQPAQILAVTNKKLLFVLVSLVTVSFNQIGIVFVFAFFQKKQLDLEVLPFILRRKWVCLVNPLKPSKTVNLKLNLTFWLNLTLNLCTVNFKDRHFYLYVFHLSSHGKKWFLLRQQN